MPKRFVVLLILLLLAACQSQPPTVIFVMVSPTPQPATVRPVETAVPIANPPLAATPEVIVTPIAEPIQVVEQPFERGRMFWLQPTRQIWVLIETEPGRGIWRIYDDTYVEGEPESDPRLVAPADNLYQPMRGFGKVWRSDERLPEEIGWALTANEFSYVTTYRYIPAGHTDDNGTYVPAPGEHILVNLGEEVLHFSEADGTWNRANP